MSSTPYRDELLRVAAWLGLPDDTDLTTISDGLRDTPPPADLIAAVNAARMQCATAEQTLQRVAALATELTVRAERAGSPQAYADMTDIAAQLAAL